MIISKIETFPLRLPFKRGGASALLAELNALTRREGRAIALDLEEVALVDVEAVRFLVACDAEGTGLRHCAPYIRARMARQGRQAR